MWREGVAVHEIKFELLGAGVVGGAAAVEVAEESDFFPEQFWKAKC